VHSSLTLLQTFIQISCLVYCFLSRRAGCYCLQYSLKPELPSGRTLRFSIDLEVTAGPPVGFDIQVWPRLGGRCCRVLHLH
jgi:hypothetical protein